jgi:DNA-binding SARP family transcriptional activator/tetratricopeptide (TPR) repeat protein
LNSPGLEIRLLGELMVLRAGRSVPLPASKKTRALLGYLVVANGAAPRSRLCELFWEGPVDPRAALRWSLTKLRPLLDEQGDPGARRLTGDRERVGFEPAGAEVDLAAVLQVAEGGVEQAPASALAAAAGRFRGELLEGLELPDCYRYREWLLAERESLRAIRRSILASLVARLREAPAEALRYARVWVGVDPLDEAAQAAVIRLLGELGQVREALAQYESCRRMLAGELATSPSDEVEDARRSLGPRGTGPLPLAAAPPRTSGGAAPREILPVQGAPLQGRGRERGELVALLDAAAAGHAGAVLLVSGEPGMGKSRLLAELAALARARGGTVLSGRAFEAEMVRPYGAWIDALRSADLADLAELGPASSGPADRGRLFDAVLQLLAGCGAAGTPTVVLLDDLQWLDDASAALLHYLAREMTRAAPGSRVLLACAARPGELADNPAALALVRALGREGRLHSLELAPLSAEETAALVRAAVSGPGDLGERAFAESRGNPLFALEVARALARGEAALSDSLDGLLSERLDRLEGRAREILPWAAALGRGFASELLGSVTGLPPAELLAGLGELERHGVLRAGEAAFDFSHDLLRQAAYRQLSAPRRRLVHRQIARVLAAEPDTDGALAGDVAHHAALGGDGELAATAAVRAGERCLRLFAPAEAAELAERALPLVRGLPRDVRLCLQIALLKVYVHSSLGRRRVAELAAELGGLVAEAEAAGRHAEVQSGLYLLSVLSEESGNFAAAESHSLHAVEATRDADPATAVRALANTGRCLAQLEREPRRAAALLAAAELARGNVPEPEVIDLPWGLGLVCLFSGDEAPAIRHLERALQLARRAQDHWAECECMARLAMIDLEAGRPALALARAPELSAAAARLGEGSEAPMAEALAAVARLALAEAGAAERLEAAVATLRAIDTKGSLAYVQNLAAEIDLAAGRPERARQRAEEAFRAAAAVDRRSQTALARALLARADLAAGDRESAAARLQEAVDPEGLSARARQALRRAAQDLGAVNGGEI